MNAPALNPQQWEALAKAEAPIYERQHGVYAWTEVNPPNETYGSIIAAMWAHAQDSVEQDDGGVDDQDAEIARRVAAAQAILTFGTVDLS